MTNEEVVAFLKVHLQSIQENDIQTYQETTAEDLTLYEWWITPHRIDGLPFHEFMMSSNTERGTVFGAEGQAKSPTRGIIPSSTSFRRSFGLGRTPFRPGWTTSDTMRRRTRSLTRHPNSDPLSR